MKLLFPAPVAPAMKRWGISAKEEVMGFPVGLMPTM